MYLTLNRPDVLNAQNQPMREALVDAFDHFERDDELRVAILSGAGRSFSAGADIKEAVARGSHPTRDTDPTLVHFDRLWALDKPVIAAIHGFAVGGGFELAQLCDVRIATRDARLGQPEARTIGGVGGVAIRHLDRLVGRGETLHIHLTAQPITGERAYQLGLVQRLVDDAAELRAAADALAAEMIACSPFALARIKQLVRGVTELSIAHVDAVERQLGPVDEADRAARRQAFLER